LQLLLPACPCPAHLPADPTATHLPTCLPTHLPTWPACLQASSDLTEEQQREVFVLRDGLVDKKDFWLLHEVTWNLLAGW